MTFVLRGRPEAENNNTVINTPWFNTELKMLETPFKPERRWSQSRVRSSNIRHLKISHKPSGVELKLSVPAGAVVTSSLVKTALFEETVDCCCVSHIKCLKRLSSETNSAANFNPTTTWKPRPKIYFPDVLGRTWSKWVFCRVKLHSDFRDADRNKGRVWQVGSFKTVPRFFDYLKGESGFNIH